MKVHAALKHVNVLEFLNAVVVELKHKQHYVPGIYMLLEFAAGGDLFDKIGMLTISAWSSLIYLSKIAPDIGVGEEVAQFYFSQLVAGIVSDHDSSLIRVSSEAKVYRIMYILKGSATVI